MHVCMHNIIHANPRTLSLLFGDFGYKYSMKKCKHLLVYHGYRLTAQPISVRDEQMITLVPSLHPWETSRWLLWYPVCIRERRADDYFGPSLYPWETSRWLLWYPICIDEKRADDYFGIQPVSVRYEQMNFFTQPISVTDEQMIILVPSLGIHERGTDGCILYPRETNTWLLKYPVYIYMSRADDYFEENKDRP